MAQDEFDIRYVANLARLKLTGEEQAHLSSQLGSILAYIEQLKKVDVSQVEPTAHPFPRVNVMRPDEITSSLGHEDALRNAPSKAGGLFIVPKIVE
ncbi:MAG: Asp-tRNA(Asn)/Glu-tRNA(Gln) amidotransferase subunit GatC [Verrucomicrobia bacterium]|nr:Asp-tRNA(Asn)/Glu-tRNA(Gln) amidotransferase subunit GatC [Verrucomicrobiota bacterium]